MDRFPSVEPEEIKIRENGERLALKIYSVKIYIIYINLIRDNILGKSS